MNVFLPKWITCTCNINIRWSLMPDLIIRDKLDKILLNIHFGLESCHSKAHANLERLKRLGLSTSVSLRANRKCFCDCPVQDCLLIHQEAARKEASSDAKKRKKRWGWFNDWVGEVDLLKWPPAETLPSHCSRQSTHPSGHGGKPPR